MRTIVAIIAILLASVCSAQEVKLAARTDSTEYKIGEWINLHILGTFPTGIADLQPLVKDSVGSFELLNVSADKPKSENSQIIQEWTFRLTQFDTGSTFIPPVEFRYTVEGDTTQRRVASSPVSLAIRGMQVDAKGDIKDIKPPVSAPWRFEDLWPYLLALLVLLLAGGLYYYYRRVRKKKEEEFVPMERRIPPHELALMQLRELEDKRLWQQGRIKEYYSEATEIVRRFFEGRFAIIALELTSEEILQQLRRFDEVEPFRKNLVQFFTTADLVKFAKYQPDPDEYTRELQWAYEIVRGLAPPTREVTSEVNEETADVR